jgi:DNA modification methylase
VTRKAIELLAYGLRPTGELWPNPRNARKHPPEQIEKIRRSMRRFGFPAPILALADGMIVAGHGRHEAALAESLPECPCLTAPPDWTEADVRAYMLADNRIAEDAAWDTKLLREEIAAIVAVERELASDAGFGESELEALLAKEVRRSDPDSAIRPAEKPVSRPGDLWHLGKHRLLCGDATDAGDVKRVLAGVVPVMMATDPPYGVGYDPNWRVDAPVSVSDGRLQNGKLPKTPGEARKAKSHRKKGQAFLGARAVGKVANDERKDWREAWALFPGDVAYVWHASYHVAVTQTSLEAAGFAIRAHIIWRKQHFIIGRGHYHWQHEPCWYAVRKGGNANWQGARDQSTIWDIKAQIGWESARPNNLNKATGHGTQKPVECMLRPIRNNSAPGQAIYDPFVGSGTTIIAAEMERRVCYAIDIDPAYVDAAILRWQEFTGKTATLADGRSFASVRNSRAKARAKPSGRPTPLRNAPARRRRSAQSPAPPS